MNNKHAILIVDDERNVRDSLSKWFREDGYDIGTAENAQSALRCLQEKKWDVVLLDIKMPGMDGMELQQRIRDTGTDPTIIFITAHDDPVTRERARSGLAYLQKPFREDALIGAIQQALENRRA